VTAYALRLENNTDTAVRNRMADLLGLQPGSGPLTARGGVRPDGGGVVAVQAGTMNVTVTAFGAFVPGGVSAAQGGYVFVSDATVTLPLTPGHATLARIDTIAARVRDNAYDGSGAIMADVLVVQGTPASSPVAPTLPTNSVPLRDVTVQAGLSTGNGGLQNSNLSTDRRRFLTSAGGVVPVASQSERDGLAAYDGLVVYRKDTDKLESYNGSVWSPYMLQPSDSGWLPLASTYTAGWGDYAGYQPGQYRKVGEWVYLRGLLLRSGSTAAGGSTVLTMPAGNRPPADLLLPIVYSNGLTDTGSRVDLVAATGVLRLGNQSIAASNYLSLNGIAFSTT
jgi:hypothetical protein